MKLFTNEKIETADPREVPFYQWFLREIFEMLGSLVSGFFMALGFIIVTGIMVGLLAKNYPNWTFKQFRNAVCNAPTSTTP